MQIVKRSLVVSIHDVAPGTKDIVEEIIDDLKRSGIDCCSLLVVPYYHEQTLLTQTPAFVEWLQTREQQGHEITLHGWCHLRPAVANEGLWTRWITQHYTRGEGEFYDLGYEEAQMKLTMGRDQLATAGFDLHKIGGFIAPAWLLSSEGERAVIDEGFTYTTRLHGVIDLRKNPPTFFRSQSMVYSVSSPWRRQVSLVWNELLFRRAQQREWPLLRVGLHPCDWHYPAIRKQALSLIRQAAKKRSVLTYDHWMKKT